MTMNKKKPDKEKELKKLLEQAVERDPGVAEAFELYKMTEELYTAAHYAKEVILGTHSANATSARPT